ncbi:DNA replication complex GINS protein PSF2 [Phytophthora nicotianae]|uniref:DNA replication complex GINS protein PSF2 n=1 Tax=Phytophthora nicotianae TaxID=4792 RepID=A0A0W8DNB5_PHYNI|nr:DNA replication complex GINS protein PSF2 [Phytophthora nicotianae]
MASLSASETEFLVSPAVRLVLAKWRLPNCVFVFVSIQAEQELILIMPQFHLRDNNGMLNFIGGNFGPFQPGITTHVPLWLAIMLKQLNKCLILPPSWLSVDYLTSRLEREKTSEVFEELPFHYLEVASLLLKNAPEDLDQGEHLRSLLEDLQNVRQDKIRNGLTKIATDVQGGGTAFAIQMNNISALEINSMREFMIGRKALRHVDFFGGIEDSDALGCMSMSPLYTLDTWGSTNVRMLDNITFFSVAHLQSLVGSHTCSKPQ